MLTNRYDSAEYFPANPGTYPFLDFGNGVAVAGASYSPSILAGMSRAQIASELADPTNPTTKEIAATANYLTAAICSIDGERPSSVCTSEGVTQAMTFAKIAPSSIASCSAPKPKAQQVCAGNGAVGKQG